MWENELAIAQKACILSGDQLSSNHESLSKVISSVEKDIKLRADFTSEKIIVSYLSKHSDYPFISEESYENGNFDLQSNTPQWIIDPLDGSLNYSRGIPLSCVSIALWKSGEPILGVVYDFNRNELFSRLSGKALLINNVEISTTTTSKVKNKSVIATGFPSGGSFEEATLLSFVKKIQDYKKVRLLGSAALSLAWVAADRMDAYCEEGIYFWDVAAGVVLLGHMSIEFSIVDNLTLKCTILVDSVKEYEK